MNPWKLAIVMGLSWLCGASALIAVGLPSRPFFISGMTALALAVLLTLWWLPKWQASKLQEGKERFEGENQARLTLAQILGGFLLLVSLYSAMENLEVARTQISLVEKGQSSLEKGQATEQFTRAVVLLGAREGGEKNKEARVGAIYSLQRLSNGPLKDLRQETTQLLAAYVRANAQFDSSRPKPTRPIQDPYWPPECRYKYSEVDPDVKAAMRALGARDPRGEPESVDWIDLQEVDLRQLWLERAWISGAYLRAARFERAFLRGTSLSNARLQDASLRCADLREVDLRWAYLKGANLSNAKLDNANLCVAHLEESTGLKPEQVMKAAHWREGFYSEELLKKLGLPLNNNDEIMKQLKSIGGSQGCWNYWNDYEAWKSKTQP
jgi:uncharacterized protein YjbI with pentapeptide repeats